MDFSVGDGVDTVGEGICFFVAVMGDEGESDRFDPNVNVTGEDVSFGTLG